MLDLIVMINFLKNLFDPAVFGGARRSKDWRMVRAIHLGFNPTCEVCGGRKKIQVHHLKPFHMFPELELDPKNLVTLCTNKKKGINCHLLVGHLGSFRKYNPDCWFDIAFICRMLS